MKDKLDAYIKKNLEGTIFVGFKKARYEVDRACCTSYAKLTDLEEDHIQFNSHNIDDFIKETKDNNKFQKLLFSHIDKKNLKDSDVYNKVHIDRRLFSKIRNENYHPSKETIILLGLALELKENEIDELLQSASYSLPKNNVYDLIIRFCFIEKIYEITKVNELLDEYKCKLLA